MSITENTIIENILYHFQRIKTNVYNITSLLDTFCNPFNIYNII